MMKFSSQILSVMLSTLRARDHLFFFIGCNFVRDSPRDYVAVIAAVLWLCIGPIPKPLLSINLSHIKI